MSVAAAVLGQAFGLSRWTLDGVRLGGYSRTHVRPNGGAAV